MVNNSTEFWKNEIITMADEIFILFELKSLKFINANLNFFSFSSYEIEDLASLSFTGLFPDFSQEQLLKYLGEYHLGTKKIYRINQTLQTKDDSARPCLLKFAFFSLDGSDYMTLIISDQSEFENYQRIMSNRLLYEKAVSNSTSLLLHNENLTQRLLEVFSLLERTLDCSKVIYCLHHSQPGQGDFFVELFQPDNIYPYTGLWEQWRNNLGQGDPVFWNINDTIFGDLSHPFLKEVSSLLVVPVFVQRKLHGFIIFSEHTKIREWEADDMLLGIMIADIISAAFLQHEYEKKLEESNRELANFASVAAHDMRAPLRQIYSFLELIKRRYYNGFDTKLQEFFDIILNSSYRIDAMTKSILDYAKIGHEEKPLEKLDLNALVFDVLTDLKDEIEKKQAQIKCAVFPEVYGMKYLITRLFMNLLTNALKFSQEGKPVEIELGYGQIPGFHLFFVKDNGCGIPREEQNKLFQLFKRINVREEISGNGIGLSACKRIVEIHKGKIWVESDSGEGASFYFTLPG
jgi:signal transduction histidine kinase